MTISSLLILLQTVVLLLSATINNPLATDEMRTQALSLSSQAFEISASFLEVNPLIVSGGYESIIPSQSVGTPANVNPIITVPASGMATTTPTAITPQDCKVPTDKAWRKVLNPEERNQLPIDIKSMNSVAQFNWYANTIGWCDK
jgi:hypothetical protein